MTKKQPELTDAEWAIIKVVWAHAPCTAGTVQEELADDRNWAYSTVKTTMDRMVKKGFLDVTPLRNLQLFSATIEPETAKRGELLRAVKRAFDGSLSPALQLLMEENTLSPDELKELKSMIRKAERDERNR
ncbi:MAG: BlaI/MecI/CopY family transcriptional regulator [Verrucomicrobiota bacterium]